MMSCNTWKLVDLCPVSPRGIRRVSHGTINHCAIQGRLGKSLDCFFLIKNESLLFNKTLKCSRCILSRALKRSQEDPWTRESYAQLENIRNQLAAHVDRSAEALRIRSRLNWTDQGEKSTAYFYRRIAGRRAVKAMTSLKRADGTRTEDPSEIARMAAHFYTKLYTRDQTSTTDQDTILNYVDKTLSADDRGELDEPISEEAVRKAIQLAPKNKSPDPDGLTAEFYQAFEEEFAPTLQRLFNEALMTDNPMDFSKKATIILIYKRKGDAESLSNWRPISLLNVDIILLTRLLARRIQRVITSIIHPDQCGFAPGHRVSWHWIERCLDKFNFGPRFRSFIQPLHNGYQASVSISGSLTAPFPITRGVRQGDPLSPSRDIAVPRLPRSITTLAYADDLTVGVADQQDITNLYQLIDTYSRAADAKINIDKTEAVALTPAARTSIDPGCEYIPAGGAITCLGIPIYLPSAANPTHMPEHPSEVYYTSQLSKLRQTIQSWRIRKLSLLGKVHLINSRLLSRIWYVAIVIRPPEYFFKELDKIIREFIWDGRGPQISLNLLAKTREEGGLGLVLPQHQTTALLAS
ncbi:uncharacterized protein VTP21DRAFT_1804 [Calcarisporiella thermophila]|uniref:uncharacterized protein n=1 Tax=Calcarisporiella thermophila TaxID=911321 RepID=UPI003742B804